MPSSARKGQPDEAARSREGDAWRALEKFGREKFVRFLRALRGTPGCIAIRLANEALDSGQTIDELFFTGEDYGYFLNVVPAREEWIFRAGALTMVPSNVLHVHFGCIAGPLAGDGGSWSLELAEDGSFSTLEQRASWIS